MMSQSPSHRRRSPSSHQNVTSAPSLQSRQGQLARRRVGGARRASTFVPGCIGISCVLAVTLSLSIQNRPLSLSVQQKAMDSSCADKVCRHDIAPRVVMLSEKGLYVSSTSAAAAAAPRQPPPLLPLPPRWIQESHFDVLPDQHSKSYQHEQAEPLETQECQLQYEWQRQSFPTCNNVHELRLQQIQLLGHGGWRDAWKIPPTAFDGPLALKTTSVFHKDRDITAYVLEGQRKDAVVMERLTGQPFVLNIYGFCGASHILELAQDGTIKDKFNDPYRPSNATRLERLHIGLQVAMGLASLHNFDQEGRASVLHGDLDVAQVLAVHHGGDLYHKINDFNLAVFLLEDRQNTTRVCPHYGQYHDYKHRSPEAYDRRIPGQSDRADVYALGNIFYQLLENHYVYNTMKKEQAIKAILKGQTPRLSGPIRLSKDPSVVALRTAMEMCYEYDQYKRASARMVETYLKEQLEKIDPGRMASWMRGLKREE